MSPFSGHFKHPQSVITIWCFVMKLAFWGNSDQIFKSYYFQWERLIYWQLKKLSWHTQGDPYLINYRLWKSHYFFVWGIFFFFLFPNFTHFTNIYLSPTMCQALCWPYRCDNELKWAWAVSLQSVHSSCAEQVCRWAWGRLSYSSGAAHLSISLRLFSFIWYILLKAFLFSSCFSFWWCVSFPFFFLDFLEEKVDKTFVWFCLYIIPKLLNESV